MQEEEELRQSSEEGGAKAELNDKQVRDLNQQPTSRKQLCSEAGSDSGINICDFLVKEAESAD